MLGADYTAEAPNANVSCAICKDTGLVLGGTVEHEIGHLMGCRHDNGVDRDRTPMADNVNASVISPRVSSCVFKLFILQHEVHAGVSIKLSWRFPAGRTPRSQLPITANAILKQV